MYEDVEQNPNKICIFYLKKAFIHIPMNIITYLCKMEIPWMRYLISVNTVKHKLFNYYVY